MRPDDALSRRADGERRGLLTAREARELEGLPPFDPDEARTGSALSWRQRVGVWLDLNADFAGAALLLAIGFLVGVFVGALVQSAFFG